MGRGSTRNNQPRNRMKLLVLAALVAHAAAVVPLGPVPWGLGGVPGPVPWGLGGAPVGVPALAHAPLLARPVAVAKVAPVDDYDPNPQYSYAYDIQDALTGDSKNQQETRSGDVVQGSYSLVEPDGTRRIVEYTADPHNGFNAVVHREPAVVKAAVAKVAAPLAYPGLAYH